MRAKFRLNARQENANSTAVLYTFNAVADYNVPEAERYAKYTPYGELRISVDNPAVALELGAEYYLDFTKVDEVNRG